jgi:sugar phosphate isomerase/epimerase
MTLVASASLILGASGAEKAKTVGVGPSFRGPVGLQLYSLRAEFAKDVPGTLQKVQDYGIKYVELAGTYNLNPTRYKAMLDAHGFVPVAAHFDYTLYRDKLPEVVKEAKALGLKYAGVAWVPHEGKFTEQAAHETAAVFNKAGEALAKEGIKFFYHNHGYEFEPYKDGTLFDILMEETKPEWVCFEMDVLWVHFPGQAPVKLLHKYGSRWELMHLKDLKIGVQTGSLSGGTDVKNDVILGSGQIDLKATLKAARKAGVKYYFIEDESPDAATQIPESLYFLEHIRF